MHSKTMNEYTHEDKNEIIVQQPHTQLIDKIMRNNIAFKLLGFPNRKLLRTLL